ncbi:hypothetical protein [Microcoleus sp. ARI1-A2]
MYPHPTANDYCQLSTVNCQLSTVNYQLPTVNCQLSTVFKPASPPVPGD